jgi:type IV pilus assembly protein PilB
LIAQVPAGLAERHSLLPIGAEPDGTLLVACADPTNIVALDDVRLASGARRVRALVASSTLIEAALRRAYGFDQRAGELIDAMESNRDDDAAELALATVTEDAPVIRLARASSPTPSTLAPRTSTSSQGGWRHTSVTASTVC